jgi:hypothetical protein
VIKSHVLYRLSYALTWRIKYLNSAGFTSLARLFSVALCCGLERVRGSAHPPPRWGRRTIPKDFAERLAEKLAQYKTMPYIPPIRVVATRGYDRRARKLFSEAERAAAELEIALAPAAWPVIAGTGGARKARAARGGRGKSGGARIIYYVMTRRGMLYLLDVYAKSAKEDLTDAEKREIRNLIAALEAEG